MNKSKKESMSTSLTKSDNEKPYMNKLHMKIENFQNIQAIELEISYINPCTKKIEYDENGDPIKKKIILTTRDIVTIVCYANSSHNEKDIILVKGRITNINHRQTRGLSNTFDTLSFIIDNSKPFESSSIEIRALDIIDIVYIHRIDEYINEPFVNIEDYLKSCGDIDIAMPPDMYENKEGGVTVPNGLIISD